MSRIIPVLILLSFLTTACAAEPSEPEEPLLRFIVMADPQLSDKGSTDPIWARPDSIASQMVSSVEAMSPDFVLCLGDQSEDGTIAELTRWENLSSNLVIHNVPGNHEDRHLDNYTSIIDTRMLYSIYSPPVHIVTFHTGESILNPDGIRAELDKYIDDPAIKFRIMSSHHQTYSNNTRVGAVAPAIRDRLFPIMEDYKVQAYFSGHGHAYERHFISGFQAGWVEQSDGSYAPGRASFVVGGAGAMGTYSTGLLESDIVDPGGTLRYKYDYDNGAPYFGNHFTMVEVFSQYFELRVYAVDGVERGDRVRVRYSKPPTVEKEARQIMDPNTGMD